MQLLENTLQELRQKTEFSKPERKAESYESDSPVALDIESRKQIGEQLDQHQASMFVLFHQYQKHHWLVEGPQFRDLHHYFEDVYNQLHKDLDEIAERLTALGGIPTSSPSSMAKLSYIAHEPEGQFAVRKMLEHDLAAEKKLIQALRHTIASCSDIPDFATATMLKGMLINAEDRAHHLDHYLANEGLNK